MRGVRSDSSVEVARGRAVWRVEQTCLDRGGEMRHSEVRTEVRVAEPIHVMLGGTATRQHISTLWLHKLAESGVEKTRAIQLAFQLAKEHAVLFDNVGPSPFSLYVRPGKAALRFREGLLSFTSTLLARLASRFCAAHWENVLRSPQRIRIRSPPGVTALAGGDRVVV
jgi:hypothetical protein